VRWIFPAITVFSGESQSNPMKRIEIVLTHSVYRRVAELAAASDLKVTEVARLGLRRILADPAGFLTWLNGNAENSTQVSNRVEDGARAA
jgi:hypothetical protein